MSEQLEFATLDEEHQHALDRHRLRTESWFDQLPINAKDQLAELLSTPFEGHTWVALAAAAGSYRASHVANGK